MLKGLIRALWIPICNTPKTVEISQIFDFIKKLNPRPYYPQKLSFSIVKPAFHSLNNMYMRPKFVYFDLEQDSITYQIVKRLVTKK